MPRRRNIFMGYLHEEGKTRDVFDEKSRLHSGNIGSVDKDGKRERKWEERVKYCSIKWCTIQLISHSLPMLGFYYITDCSKEMIITKGGKSVAPVPIENSNSITT